jgi:hypothetical protein
MSEAAPQETTTKPAKPPKRAKKSSPPKPPSEFTGITPTKCPTACTVERCVISTVNVCKHPLLSPANGCGPVTLANRDKAAKLLKRQKIG